jgi:hypothetical protein
MQIFSFPLAIHRPLPYASSRWRTARLADARNRGPMILVDRIQVTLVDTMSVGSRVASIFQYSAMRVRFVVRERTRRLRLDQRESRKRA